MRLVPSVERVPVREIRADAQRPCILFPLACPVAASRGAVFARKSFGDALSAVLVTEMSLTLGLATARLGDTAAAANSAAAVKTIDLRMGLLR